MSMDLSISILYVRIFGLGVDLWMDNASNLHSSMELYTAFYYVRRVHCYAVLRKGGVLCH